MYKEVAQLLIETSTPRKSIATSLNSALDFVFNNFINIAITKYYLST